MTPNSYLVWSDPDPKRTTRDKIAAGAARYIERFGCAPPVVLVSLAEMDDAVDVPGARAMWYVRKHNYWFGTEDPIR